MSLFDLLSVPEPAKAKEKSVKRRVAVIDCETDPFKRGRVPKPFIWGFYDGEVFEHFHTVEEMLVYLDAREEPFRVYAHNGGKFDYHFMLDYLEPSQEITVINGRLAKFKIGRTEFRDSYNLFNFPLAAYKKDEFDYSIMEPAERDKPHNRRAIITYLEKDCVYLYELVSDFIQRYGLHLTQAGAAMQIWQKMADIKAPQSDAVFYDTFKEYYYGGRVECGRVGIIKRPFTMLDITSAYPYAMLYKHPLSLDYDEYNGRKAEAFIDSVGGFGMVDIGPMLFRVLGRSKGAFPFRHPTSRKLLFPNDNIKRVYSITGYELAAGLSTNTFMLDKIVSVTVFKEEIDFTGYVKRFYALKEEADKAGDKLTRLFAKLFLNALYGKWGADPRGYKTVKVDEPTAVEVYRDKGFNDAGMLGEWMLFERPLNDNQQRFYNVATAASITGFVRAYLWRAICECGEVLYCDTDSIAAHDVSGVPLSDELGGWDIDGQFSEGAIAGKKLYAFKYADKDGYKIASKGVRLTAKEIYRVAKGAVVRYSPEEPTFSLRSEPRFVKRKIKRT